MKSALTLAALTALSLGFAQKASACACCASKGTYRQYMDTLRDDQLEQFVGRKVEGTFEQTSGENDVTMSVPFTGTIAKDALTLNLTLDGKPAGTLTVHLPSRASFLETDLLGQTQYDVTLYKQIVLRGRAVATDARLKDSVGYATVILKGEGNSCGWEMKELILQTGKGNLSFGGMGTISAQ